MCTSRLSKRHNELFCLAVISFLIMGSLNTVKAQMKTYSGKRVSNDSSIFIYYYDTIIAVTEWGPKNMLGCEFIAVNNDQQNERIRQDLSEYNSPVPITFQDMINLSINCERVNKLNYAANNAGTPSGGLSSIFDYIPSINPILIPGTKWCGAGDIAKTYHDLGVNIDTDRCCRQHDFCPFSLQPNETRDSFTNDSRYTKSHCVCDKIFFTCLKNVHSHLSIKTILLYFSLIECVSGIDLGK